MFNDSPSSNFNVSTNHPLIKNSNDYIIYKKYVSIHSEDRNIIKYPNSNSFEIELPQDIVNVYALRLVNWTFPANYNTFSILNSNVSMTFKITNPYNPGENNPNSTDLQNQIFACLYYSYDENYVIIIEEGFYNPTQMANELTNKFNEAVSIRIYKYLTDNAPYLIQEFIDQGGYTAFKMVYNAVGQKIWFGNNSDQFLLTNEVQVVDNLVTPDVFCGQRQQNPSFSEWGLSNNLGLSRCDTESITINSPITGEPYTPKFYYGNVSNGDDGVWIVPNPNLPNAVVYFIEPPYKINLMGPAYFYMDIAGQNSIDETSPYNVSEFTLNTNQTNGVCNSSFAKIAIPTTPISQWFDRDSLPYKMYYPPAERIRKLNVKLRYHNGLLVDFGVFNYSFTIEFTQLVPQQNKKINIVNMDVLNGY
jgi:hypothetical protein